MHGSHLFFSSRYWGRAGRGGGGVGVGVGARGVDKALAGKLDRIGKQVKGVAAGQILFITPVKRVTYSAGLQWHQAICDDVFVRSIKHQEIVKNGTKVWFIHSVF